MTSEHLLEPVRPVTIGGQVYTLKGTLGALKEIQHAFGKPILDVHAAVLGLSFDDLARLIALGIKGNGETPPAPEAVEQWVLEDNGIEDTQKLMLEWLLMAVTPKKSREKKMADFRATLDAIEKAREAMAAKPKK